MAMMIDMFKHFWVQNKLYPKLIQDVQVVISELGMITVLWEEQWLTTLQDLHAGKAVNLLL